MSGVAGSWVNRSPSVALTESWGNAKELVQSCTSAVCLWRSRYPRQAAGGRDSLSAPIEPAEVRQPPKSRRSIHLEQGFEATRLNTGAMTDLASLAADFLANFRTVRIRPPERVEVPPGDWWAMVKARRSAHRAAHAYRDRLCQGLAEHGYHRVLDRMEPDPAGGWRLHFFVADVAALNVLNELTEGLCGPGDPVSSEPEDFVSARLRHLIGEDDTRW
jgi:hypothetical protein